MLQFFQQVILGIIQGVCEWLPFSSEGMLLLVGSNFFGITDLTLFVRQALFLHLGTFFAALIYFRKDVAEIFRGIVNYKYLTGETRKLINFLVIATIISGFVGLAFLQLLKFVTTPITLPSKIITAGVGFFLLISATLQIKAKSIGIRRIYHLNEKDSILLGFVQGLAALPGISRSGITISTLLLRKIDDKTALKLSFLMSLPIVLLGNIVLNLTDFQFISGMFVAFLFAFVFGLLTIHLLMKIAERLKFGHFILFMAILVLASVLVI